MPCQLLVLWCASCSWAISNNCVYWKFIFFPAFLPLGRELNMCTLSPSVSFSNGRAHSVTMNAMYKDYCLVIFCCAVQLDSAQNFSLSDKQADSASRGEPMVLDLREPVVSEGSLSRTGALLSPLECRNDPHWQLSPGRYPTSCWPCPRRWRLPYPLWTSLFGLAHERDRLR